MNRKHQEKPGTRIKAKNLFPTFYCAGDETSSIKISETALLFLC